MGEKATKTCLKSLGFGGFGIGSNTAEVEVDTEKNRIIRINPLHINDYYDDNYLRKWKYEKKGKTFSPRDIIEISPFSIAYKNRLYSKRRIPFPMKRVDWDPKGERNPQNRGISKYTRISWDEATQIVADEIRRVSSDHSPFSILCQIDGHGEEKILHASHGCAGSLLSVYNHAFTYQMRNPDSWEGWYWGAKFVWGDSTLGLPLSTNMLLDVVENCHTLLHWGCDAETSTLAWSSMLASRFCFFCTEIGIKQVFISPDLNYSAAVHADKWIPIYPNTDVALQLAVAHTWLENEWYDKEYMKTHTDGFDWVKYHIYGGDDGIPKTPKWAEEKTGIPARQIKALAKQWYLHTTTIAHHMGGSYIRSAFSTEPARMEGLLMAMQGLGKPGRGELLVATWAVMGESCSASGPMSEVYPSPAAAYQGYIAGLFDPESAVYDARKSFIPKTLVPEAILGDYTLEHPLKWHGTGQCPAPRDLQLLEFQYPSSASGGARIHMIWSDTPCWTTCWNGGNRFIQALRSEEIETVVIQHPWFENDCLYADILLPVTSKAEEEDIAVNYYNGYYSMLYLEDQCVEPLNESKSDWVTCCEIAKKLGCYDEFTRNRTPEQWLQRGFEDSGITDGTTWEEFKEKKLWASRIREDWKAAPRGYTPFAEDPLMNPLPTPTGKLEFYSTILSETFPDDNERAPYPRWIEETDRIKERLDGERAEAYPYLLQSNHPRWRCHAQHDDSQWMREIPTCKVTGPDGYQYEPVWINPVEAKKHGIESGDIVKIYNDRGWVLGGAIVTERISLRTIYQDHGARIDPIEHGISDRGGANNLIAPHHCASKNTVAENTSGFLVNIEKVDVFELAEQYPEAFNRPIVEGFGVDIANWLVDETER